MKYVIILTERMAGTASSASCSIPCSWSLYRVQGLPFISFIPILSDLHSLFSPFFPLGRFDDGVWWTFVSVARWGLFSFKVIIEKER